MIGPEHNDPKSEPMTKIRSIRKRKTNIKLTRRQAVSLCYGEVSEMDRPLFNSSDISDFPDFEHTSVVSCLIPETDKKMGEMRFIIEDEEEDFYK